MDIVSDQKHGIAFFVCLDKNVCHDLSIFPIKIACRLVSDDEFWVMNKGSC